MVKMGLKNVLHYNATFVNYDPIWWKIDGRAETKRVVEYK